MAPILPKGWIQSVSKTKNNLYYYNSVSKQSQLKRPIEDALVEPKDEEGQEQLRKVQKTSSSVLLSLAPSLQSTVAVSIVANGLPFQPPTTLSDDEDIELPPTHSLNIHDSHVKREAILSAMEQRIGNHTISAIIAPHGQGKTSTVLIYKEFHPEWKFLTFNYLNKPDNISYVNMFRDAIGLDEFNNVQKGGAIDSLVHPQTGYMIWIDDAQKLYVDHDFWEYLIRRIHFCLVCQNVPFAILICATQTITTVSTSPVCLNQSYIYKVKSVAMSDLEARAMITQHCPFGLHKSIAYPELIDLIVSECGGHCGVLRHSINMLNERSLLQPYFVDSSLDARISYFMSYKTAEQYIVRCFSLITMKVVNQYEDELIAMLSEPIFDRYPDSHTIPTVNRSEKQLVREQFADSGILVICNYKEEYASPLMMRIMCVMLFPDLALFPTDECTRIRQLVMEAVIDKPVSALIREEYCKLVSKPIV